jgi:dipeptidyl-peptidase-4
MRNILLLGLVMSSFIGQAQKQITVENIYRDGTFRSKSVYGVRWMNDGQFYSALKDNKVVKYDVTTGEQVETILDGALLNPAIKITDYSFSTDEQQMLLLTDKQPIYRRSYTAVFSVYDRRTKTLNRLATGRQAYGTFSPDGSKVAFTRENNLYYVNLADNSEVQVTGDGRLNRIINGSTDWVYEEELSLTKAFYWSPDSKKLAFYRFDESEVREYHLQKWHNGALYPEDYVYKYPKAGEQNAEVAIGIYHLADQQTVWADLGEDKDIYIPRVIWTNDAGVLSVRRMNRLQNILEVLHVNVHNGEAALIFQDSEDTYVELNDDLTYLDDGKHMIVTSERSGYKHIYLYTTEGKPVRQITTGDWEVADFAGINQKDKTLYYTSREESPKEKYFYSIALNGKNKQKLSTLPGMNRVNMSNDFKYYINYNSSAASPNKVELFRTKGNRLVKVLEENSKLAATSKEYGLVDKEFFSFNTADGTSLNGYMLKPAEFDPAKTYPVLMFQYSGPGSQNVSNSWAGSNYYWHQMLAQKGIIIAVIDGRGTGARGAHFKKQTYRQLGRLEVIDQIEGAKYLGGLPYVDANRIGLWGWSYGGYISALGILQGADVFAMAISVAPVTSWRYYDTIYTERFLATPQDNAAGYDDNSPVQHAAKLKGQLLLVHGTGDDNVHFQNSVALQNALIHAGKQFDSFYYPDRTHGIYKDNARVHLYHMMTTFVVENLLLEADQRGRIRKVK